MVNNQAVSDLLTEMVLNVDPLTKGKHSLCVSEKGWKKVNVSTTTLDEYCQSKSGFYNNRC